MGCSEHHAHENCWEVAHARCWVAAHAHSMGPGLVDSQDLTLAPPCSSHLVAGHLLDLRGHCGYPYSNQRQHWAVVGCVLEVDHRGPGHMGLWHRDLRTVARTDHLEEDVGDLHMGLWHKAEHMDRCWEEDVHNGQVQLLKGVAHHKG